MDRMRYLQEVTHLSSRDSINFRSDESLLRLCMTMTALPLLFLFPIGPPLLKLDGPHAIASGNHSFILTRLSMSGLMNLYRGFA